MDNAEQTIFDWTQASLDPWEMAWPGDFRLGPDGTTTGWMACCGTRSPTAMWCTTGSSAHCAAPRTRGGEIKDPHRNLGRAIVISLIICVVVYLLVAWAVGSTLTINRIVAAKTYSLAEAARPAFSTGTSCSSIRRRSFGSVVRT